MQQTPQRALHTHKRQRAQGGAAFALRNSWETRLFGYEVVFEFLKKASCYLQNGREHGKRGGSHARSRGTERGRAGHTLAARRPHRGAHTGSPRAGTRAAPGQRGHPPGPRAASERRTNRRPPLGRSAPAPRPLPAPLRRKRRLRLLRWRRRGRVVPRGGPELGTDLRCRAAGPGRWMEPSEGRGRAARGPSRPGVPQDCAGGRRTAAAYPSACPSAEGRGRAAGGGLAERPRTPGPTSAPPGEGDPAGPSGPGCRSSPARPRRQGAIAGAAGIETGTLVFLNWCRNLGFSGNSGVFFFAFALRDISIGNCIFHPSWGFLFLLI